MLNANFPEPMNLHTPRYCFRINRVTGFNGRLNPDFNWVPNRTYPPLFYFRFYSTPPRTREKNSEYKKPHISYLHGSTNVFRGNAKLGVRPHPPSRKDPRAKQLTGKAL